MSLNAHDRPGAQAAALRPEPAEFACEDGVGLRGHLWRAAGAGEGGAILVNAATGVLARYYHRYARFLAGHGFDVLTYDYRGIGLSRPERLKGCGYRWRDWGMQDFAAALRFLHEATGCPRPMVVGHSIGGFLPGLAPNAAMIGRMLTGGGAVCLVGRLRAGAPPAASAQMARRHARRDGALRLLPRPPPRVAGGPAGRRGAGVELPRPLLHAEPPARGAPRHPGPHGRCAGTDPRHRRDG
nr:alpha/beta fold hydrolase [Roseomonas sp. KE0001]